jgi:hypothetical protein
MYSYDDFIPLNFKTSNKKDNCKNNLFTLEDNKVLPRQSTTIKKHNKIKAAKLFLSIALLFSTTIIMATSNQVQPVSAISFGKTKNLSNNPGNQALPPFYESPQLEASGNNVYTVWGDDTIGDGDTFFRKSSDFGNSFHGILDLSHSNGNDGDAIRQKIAKEGNNVYVVWSEDGDIFFRKSTNSGSSFGGIIRLSNDNHFSTLPQIAVVGKNVYIVWVDIDKDDSSQPGESQLFFKKSTNYGASFSSVKKISDITEDIDPRIAALGGNVYVSFAGGSEEHTELFFTRSTDEGNSFSNVISLNKNNKAALIGDIATAGKNVYITWEDDSLNDDHHAFLARSTDNGASFDNAKDLGFGIAGSNTRPQIDTISSNVYIVWTSKDGIAFRASTNNGASFANTKMLSSSGDSPQISSIGKAVRVVWDDSSKGKSEVFFRASGNEGGSFGSIKNLSNNKGDSFVPMVISSGNNVYVTWFDNTPGNWETFFKKGVD